MLGITPVVVELVYGTSQESPPLWIVVCEMKMNCTFFGRDFCWNVKVTEERKLIFVNKSSLSGQNPPVTAGTGYILTYRRNELPDPWPRPEWHDIGENMFRKQDLVDQNLSLSRRPRRRRLHRRRRQIGRAHV